MNQSADPQQTPPDPAKPPGEPPGRGPQPDDNVKPPQKQKSWPAGSSVQPLAPPSPRSATTISG